MYYIIKFVYVCVGAYVFPKGNDSMAPTSVNSIIDAFFPQPHPPPTPTHKKKKNSIIGDVNVK